MAVRDDLFPDVRINAFLLLLIGTLGMVFVTVMLFFLSDDTEPLRALVSDSGKHVLRDYVYAALILGGIWVFGIRIANLRVSDLGFRHCDADWLIRAVLLGSILFSLRTLADAAISIFLGIVWMVEPTRSDAWLLHNSSWYARIAFLIALILITPIATEIFQRGILFAWLRRNFNFILSAIASSIVFGVLHVEVGRMFQVMIFGVCAAYLYEKSGSIWPSIALHMTLNTAYALSLLM